MSSAGSATVQQLLQREAANAPSAKGLTSLVYRSIATAALSELELQRLVNAAQARNRAESITGLMIYDEGRIFQWLEGPSEAVARIWKSIRSDPRHTSIEILGEQPTLTRFFGDWHMKLAARHMPGHSPQADLLDAPDGLIETLKQRPDTVPALLLRLVPRSPATIVTGPAIRALAELVVIPKLLARHAAGPRPLAAVDSHAPELARLLLAADPDAAFALIDSLRAPIGTSARLFSSLFEPAARLLGDLWSADECSEFDVTLGLCRIQTALRDRADAAAAPQLRLKSVLIAPQPGELHMLGAVLDAELLWRAGWSTQSEWPSTDLALKQMVAETWFDVLDLSLSPSFQREHWLPRMTETIAQARSASLNPALVIVVGGRAFVEHPEAGTTVGADGSSPSAARIEQLMLDLLPPEG